MPTDIVPIVDYQSCVGTPATPSLWCLTAVEIVAAIGYQGCQAGVQVEILGGPYASPATCGDCSQSSGGGGSSGASSTTSSATSSASSAQTKRCVYKWTANWSCTLKTWAMAPQPWPAAPDFAGRMTRSIEILQGGQLDVELKTQTGQQQGRISRCRRITGSAGGLGGNALSRFHQTTSEAHFSGSSSIDTTAKQAWLQEN